MLEKRIRHIPILGKAKELLGIMSIRDVLKNYHLYSLPQNNTPTLNPIDPSQSGHKRTIHLLCPTAKLDSILEELFGAQIQFKTWTNAAQFTNSKAFQEIGGNPLVVDLDGISKSDWQNLITTLRNSKGKIHPKLFVILNPAQHPPEEIESLKAVGDKLAWHVYGRPVPIAALINDMAELRLPR